MAYILRLAIPIGKSASYLTLEKPISDVTPMIGDSISMITPDGQALFTVTSLIHYPDKNTGPLIIAKIDNVESVDDAAILIDSIKIAYSGFIINACDVVKPAWYEVLKLVRDFGCADTRVIVEVTRSIMLSTNIEVAMANDLFQPHVTILFEELSKSDTSIAQAFSRWGKKVELETLQIAPEVIQLMVINATRFLSKAGIDASVWPSRCIV